MIVFDHNYMKAAMDFGFSMMHLDMSRSAWIRRYGTEMKPQHANQLDQTLFFILEIFAVRSSCYGRRVMAVGLGMGTWEYFTKAPPRGCLIIVLAGQDPEKRVTEPKYFAQLIRGEPTIEKITDKRLWVSAERMSTEIWVKSSSLTVACDNAP